MSFRPLLLAFAGSVGMTLAVGCSEFRSTPTDSDGDASPQVRSDASAPAPPISAQEGGVDAGADSAEEPFEGGAKSDVRPAPATVEVVTTLSIGPALPQGPFDMVHAAGRLFVATGDQVSSVLSVSVDGSDTRSLAPFENAYGRSMSISASGGQVFWLLGGSSGAIYRAEMAGGAPIRVVDIDSPEAFAVHPDGSSVYWADRELPSYSVRERAVLPDAETKVVAGSQIRVSAIAADADGLYWALGGPMVGGHASIRMRRHAAAGASAQPIVDLFVSPDPSELGEIAVDQGSVYWADTEGDRLMTVPKAGGSARVLDPQATNVTEIAVDPTSVYYAAARSVLRIDKAGGNPEVLASSVDARGLVVVDPYLYWLTPKGELQRIRVR